MKLRKMAVTLTAGALLIGGAVPAFAADSSDAVLSGQGSLSITNPSAGNFSVLLDGTAKTAYSTLENFDVEDARGTGAGWNVTVQASQFAEHNGTSYVASGKTLAQNSLQLAAPTVAKIDSSSSAEPSITGGPYTIDGAAAVKIASATGPGGMGSYTFTEGDLDGGTAGSQALQLSVPANAFAATYRSDVTVSIVSGP